MTRIIEIERETVPTNELPEYTSTDAQSFAPLPNNVSCPFVASAGWLDVIGFWYGPFVDQNGISYSISYDFTQIYVWNSLNGTQAWSDPQTIGGRNQWLTLEGTPFKFV